jgi:restriction endonuclease S subunit
MKNIIDTNNLNMSITNKDALKDKIHEIHNFLRNNGAGYGMNALKVFNIIYGLKKIEENNLLDKVNLKRPECEFSHLLKLANENKDEQITELIFNTILPSIFKSNIKDLLFYKIPNNIKSSIFSQLVKEIENITIIEKTCNVLLSGKIYEYFVGRDASAISELGAYFTDRHIVEYIFNKLKPKICKNSKIKNMIDMFGGSGGFTTGYINYINENYEIDWNTEINKIYHYDINEDVIKSAGLEFFCLTGVLPNMNNLKYKNSFYDEFVDDSNKKIKYQYIITNPPYGGDKSKTSDSNNKRNKIKEYIKKELLTLTDEDIIEKRQKQLKEFEAQEKQDKKEQEKNKVSLSTCSARIQAFAKKYDLKGNDKESCSLMLMMELLDNDGICIGVLKEGVFFDKKYSSLRKTLIENFNITEVISVPQDQFENTSTKTSIIIFSNTENKTNNVIFRELIVEKYNEDIFEEINDIIYIKENKGDIKELYDKVISEATIDELLENKINSLNGKDYNKKEIKVGKDYELVKLNDICESYNGYAFKTDEYQNNGIPLITITHIKNKKILFNNNNFIEESEKYAKYEIKYHDLILTLTGKKPLLCSIGINYNTDKQYLNQRCAILRNFKKINIYYFVAIFDIYMLDYINKNIGNGSNQENISLSDILNINIPIPKSQDKIKEWVDKISKPYNKKIKYENKLKELETQVQDRIKEITENEDCEEVELGSICEFIKTGKNKTPDNKQGTLYPYYGTADITGYTDHYLFDGEHILVARNGTMGNCFYVKGKIYPSDHIFVIKNKKEYNLKYIYYLIKSLSQNIQNNSNGSIIKGISKENLSNIITKIPKNKKLISNMDVLFEEIETMQQKIKDNGELYKQYIEELSNEAIPKTNNIKIEDITITEKKNKTKKIKKSKNIINEDIEL